MSTWCLCMATGENILVWGGEIPLGLLTEMHSRLMHASLAAQCVFTVTSAISSVLWVELPFHGITLVEHISRCISNDIWKGCSTSMHRDKTIQNICKPSACKASLILFHFCLLWSPLNMTAFATLCRQAAFDIPGSIRVSEYFHQQFVQNIQCITNMSNIKPK